MMVLVQCVLIGFYTNFRMAIITQAIATYGDNRSPVGSRSVRTRHEFAGKWIPAYPGKLEEDSKESADTGKTDKDGRLLRWGISTCPSLFRSTKPGATARR